MKELKKSIETLLDFQLKKLKEGKENRDLKIHKYITNYFATINISKTYSILSEEELEAYDVKYFKSLGIKR